MLHVLQGVLASCAFGFVVGLVGGGGSILAVPLMAYLVGGGGSIPGTPLATRLAGRKGASNLVLASLIVVVALYMLYRAAGEIGWI